MTKNTKRTHRGAGRVAFLARLADFQRLLEAGHPMRSIYDDHKDQLGIGYPQFTKYVSRYIRKESHDRDETKAPNQQAIQAPAPASSDGASQQPNRPKKPATGFVHDASSGNNRDDLI